MALEKYLERLKSINGYKASGIMTFTGEVLASDSIDANIDPAMVGPIFNDLFRAAHEASEKIGLEACLETTITTPKGFVVMRCSGLDAPIHFHLMVLLAVDGNAAMAKMELAKIEPLILKQIAG